MQTITEVHLVGDERLAEDITRSIEWRDREPADLQYAPCIGHLALGNEKDGIEALGFHAPKLQDGGILPEAIFPITALDELPSEDQTIDLQGKGVGPRLYNTWQAVMGLRKPPELVGVYIFPVRRPDGREPLQIGSLRQESDHTLAGKGIRAARHLLRRTEAQLTPGGLERVTDRIHRSYEPHDMVTMNQPPQPEQRQRHRGFRDDHIGIAAGFTLLRNNTLPMRLVGQIDPYRAEHSHR
jgi:hypothetical protein